MTPSLARLQSFYFFFFNRRLMSTLDWHWELLQTLAPMLKPAPTSVVH